MKYWRARAARRRPDSKDGGRGDATASSPGARRSRSTGCWRGRACKQAGHPEPIALPVKKVDVAAPSKPLREPSIARADELIEAGMNVEAGEELEHNEKEILKHLGGDKALPWLIDLYKRAGNYHRVYRLGESRGGGRAGRRSAARRGHARDVGGGVSRAPTSRWSRSTAPPPATRSCSSTRSCARSRGSTRTTSRTPTRAACCR